MTNVPILLYHDIHADGAKPKNNFAVSETEFKKQITFLLHNGFVGVSLAKFLKKDEDTRKKVILTFDDGDISNREIAACLSLAEGTVKNYVTGILQKLGVRDRTQAAVRARELGVI